MSAPLFPPRHLLVLAVAEGLVIASAVLRVALQPHSVNLDRPLHLGWLLGTLLVATFAVALFVFRSSALTRTATDGSDVSNERKQILAYSLVLVGLAAMVSAAGPAALERLLESGEPTRVGQSAPGELLPLRVAATPSAVAPYLAG